MPLADFSQGVEWKSYTPVWTSTGTAPALGNGALTGRYVLSGAVLIAAIQLTMGSTTTFGTGIYSLSLPLSAVYPINGQGTAVDQSAGPSIYSFTPRWNSATTLVFLTPAQPAGFYGNTIPFTWAVSDDLTVTVVGELRA